MPIYSYLCTSCNFSKDVLQKLSDIPLSICPKCKKGSFEKQLTSAGFVLKGSGWYATDFKDQKKADKKDSKSEPEKNNIKEKKGEVKKKNEVSSKKGDVNKKGVIQTSKETKSNAGEK